MFDQSSIQTNEIGYQKRLKQRQFNSSTITVFFFDVQVSTLSKLTASVLKGYSSELSLLSKWTSQTTA